MAKRKSLKLGMEWNGWIKTKKYVTCNCSFDPLDLKFCVIYISLKLLATTKIKVKISFPLAVFFSDGNKTVFYHKFVNIEGLTVKYVHTMPINLQKFLKLQSGKIPIRFIWYPHCNNNFQ